MSNLPKAKELGFNPIYQQLTDEQSRMLISILLSNNEPDIPENEIPFPIKIIEKRIDVLKLPIKLTTTAKLLLLVLTDGNPGKMVTSLIDCLVKFENQTVTKDMVCDLYPNGFYNENSFIEYVDNYLKLKKSKWSEIY